MNVELPEDLLDAVGKRVDPRHADSAVESGLRGWLDLTDGRGERGSALALLLDEVGASARGELPPPDHEQLGDWLRLLNKIAGSGRD
jgi:hypothetical protein